MVHTAVYDAVKALAHTQFWADGAGTYTPPGHWNSIAAEVSQQQGNTLEENARLQAISLTTNPIIWALDNCFYHPPFGFWIDTD